MRPRGRGALQKKKVNTRFSNSLPERIVFHNRGLTVLFKSFSALVVKGMLEIKDNSNFIKDKDRGVQIKDGWQPYTRLDQKWRKF